MFYLRCQLIIYRFEERLKDKSEMNFQLEGREAWRLKRQEAKKLRSEVGGTGRNGGKKRRRVAEGGQGNDQK